MPDVSIQVKDTLSNLALIIAGLPSGAQGLKATIQVTVKNVTRNYFDNTIVPLMENLKTQYPDADIHYVLMDVR